MSILETVEWPAVRRPAELGALVFWSAAELSSAIRSRAVSCVEVMTAYLDHIDRVNPAVNAIVALRPRAELLAEAAEKDRLLDAGAVEGWMHGFPQAVKDLADVRGWPTSFGFFRAPYPAPVADRDDIFVERIRAAGAIFIGRTNTPEFGLGSHTYNGVYGTTGNAYDPTRSAGGSSGGAAVAVALRMLPVADGSDFMGSLRNPPGWNNVLGLRPSVGRVPALGEQFAAQGGVEGPIARDARDLGLLLATMAGYDDRSPMSIHDDPGRFARVEAREPASLRIGWLGDLGGYLPVEPEVLEVARAALGRLAGAGATIVELDALPAFGTFGGAQDLWPTWLTYRHWSNAAWGAALYEDPGLRAMMKPELVFEIEGGIGGAGAAPLTGLDFAAASQRRSDLYEAMRRLFAGAGLDAIALPTAQLFPFDATWDWPSSVAGREMSSYHRWMEATTIATLINAPALAVPAGFGSEGLPIGVQLIGPNHADAELLGIAAAWERALSPITAALPPLLSR